MEDPAEIIRAHEEATFPALPQSRPINTDAKTGTVYCGWCGKTCAGTSDARALWSREHRCGR